MGEEIKENKKEKVRGKSPLDYFFKIGDKISKDPIKQMDFSYYMFWILFLAFFGMFVANLIRFIQSLNPIDILWSIVGFAVMALQFFNLKNFHQMRKARKDMKITPEEEEKVESMKDMLGGFEKK